MTHTKFTQDALREIELLSERLRSRLELGADLDISDVRHFRHRLSCLEMYASDYATFLEAGSFEGPLSSKWEKREGYVSPRHVVRDRHGRVVKDFNWERDATRFIRLNAEATQ